MSGFKDLGTLNMPAIAEAILTQWQTNDTFKKIQAEKVSNTPWVFYEGPPSANGTPGIHHVMARAIKDIFCRYKTQQGYYVDRKAGWDTHGLPVELQVEKELGIKKEDIGVKISIEDYNEKCREAVMRFTEQWNTLTERIGYWVDLDHPYVTYTDDYIETLWNLLARLYDKGLLYKGYTIQPYSPAAGTALSSHELNQPGTYRDVKDTSIVAQFLLDDVPTGIDTKNPIYALAWTTTPWTLPANSALAVGSNINYTIVDSFNQYTGQPGVFILGEDVVGKYFTPAGLEADMKYELGQKILPYRGLGTRKGSELVGLKYIQLLPYIQPDGKAFEIIEGDFVTTSEGTGIVHISPTFGADDFRAAQLAGIEAIMVKDENGKPTPIVNRKGQFVDEITDFAGMYVKNYNGADEADPSYRSTDVLISIKLKEENKAFKVEKYEHPYPHCWRTDKPVLYYPIDSWFIKTTALKDRLLELNKTINWKPASTGTGRFGNWLDNLVDWNLSRSRFWGTPLPLWRSEDGHETWCASSRTALLEAIAVAQNSNLLTTEEFEANENFYLGLDLGTKNLHRPYVDAVTLIQNGKKLVREADLIDVWFDSGAMPYAQQHYPFQGHENFPPNFPADFIAEGVDQTRGWFFTLHALGVLLFDSVAFKSVVSNGLVLDKDGNKMSKRLGNAVNPFETLDKYGADATRWYMIANASPWENLRFNVDGIEEVQRKYFGTLHNTYQFFSLYANLDRFSPDAGYLTATSTIDNWLLSRLNSVVGEVSERMEDLDPTPAVRAIQDFITEDVSNWYVRLNRKRFWKGSLDEDKLAAYQTLYTCLETVSRLMAPFAPFYAEYLYEALHKGNGGLGVHDSTFPKADFATIAPTLEQEMGDVRSIVSLIHAVRKKHQLKVRMPLLRALIPTDTENMRHAIDHLKGLIAHETNIKEIEVISSDSDLIKKTAKLNFKVAGKKLGPQVNAAANLVKALSPEQIRQFEKDGELSVTLEGITYTLTQEDIDLATQDVPGWIISTDGALTVALDLSQTDELIHEGMARELVNRIQNLRKDSGLDVTDRVEIRLQAEDVSLFTSILLAHGVYIKEEVQADVLELVTEPQPYATEVENNMLTLALNPIGIN